MSGTRYRWPVLRAAFLTYLFDSRDLIALAIAMPFLMKVLGITFPERMENFFLTGRRSVIMVRPLREHVPLYR
jgi:hypothetical protein